LAEEGLIADGHIHRCDVVGKGPSGKGDGSYLLHLNYGGVAAGGFQNWTDGQGWENWVEKKGRPLTAAEEKEIDRAVKAASGEFEKERVRRREQARRKAIDMWCDAGDGSADHPYCRRKHVEPRGLTMVRFKSGPVLLAPMLDEHDELQNLQFIHADGRKHFLKGGRAAGSHFWVAEPNGQDGSTICVCEGWATGASIFEATEHAVVCAFYAGNLKAVAEWVRERYPQHRIVICADDDWKTKENPGSKAAWEAADAVGGFVAMPRFKEPRNDKDTDFNDMLLASDAAAVKRAIDAAAGRLPERKRPETSVELQIDKLAALSQLDYESRRTEAARELGMRVTVLDKEVAKRSKKSVPAPAPVAVDIDKLALSARKIIESKDVLTLFAKEFSKVVAGEVPLAKILYLAGTSRLFEKPIHCVVKGPSAGGKSETRARLLDFFPAEDVISFTTLSEKAMLYMEGDLKHKILSMGEASNRDEFNFQDYLLRELMSEGKLRYPVVQKIDGQLATITLEIDGPVAFMVTTTRNKLNPENETRMLSLEVNDSEQQTRDVLRKVADVVGYNKGSQQIDLLPWQDYQRSLATGETRVIVPFARALSNLIPPRAVRLRRDFAQVLQAIKAHALLHRQHRARNKDGQIRASFRDYEPVRELMVDLLAETAEVKLSRTVAETIQAVMATQPDDENQGASVREIAAELRLDRSSASRRLRKAEDSGLVVNVEQRRGHPKHYRTTGEELATTEMLPSTDTLRAAWTATLRRVPLKRR
jgi:phage/plasmid primase-like uncharacterized protein/DNA-binding MarR family transcriptional regulator